MRVVRVGVPDEPEEVEPERETPLEVEVPELLPPERVPLQADELVVLPELVERLTPELDEL